jgi:hypothetical protein
LRGCPEANSIDTPVWFLAGDVDGAEGKLPRGMPRHSPIVHPCFNCVDDLGRDPAVNVPLIACGILVCRHRETRPFAVFRNRRVFSALADSVSCIARINQIIECGKLLGVTAILPRRGWGIRQSESLVGGRQRGR